MPTVTNAVDTSAVVARLELARRLAREAGVLTLRYFQSPDLAVDEKSDGSPVTIADKKSEELIRAGIQAGFPDDGILGEEFGHSKPKDDAGFTWIVDPIDGTRSFSRGIPSYAVLIGLEYAGRSVGGVVELPGMGERLWAHEGGGAFWQTARNETAMAARVSATPTLAEAWLEIAQPRQFRRSDRWGAFDRLVMAAGRTQGWSDADAFALVATGRVDGAIQFGVSAWDIAPFDCIMHEAGGLQSDWTGRRTLDARFVVASNGLIHQELLTILSPHAGAR
ncbi:MAG: inositol monophosphatase [Phycisphaerales bacterium]|nr:MAG: inositol monophosphatase [Phycisphaerales bacterium]